MAVDCCSFQDLFIWISMISGTLMCTQLSTLLSCRGTFSAMSLRSSGLESVKCEGDEKHLQAHSCLWFLGSSWSLGHSRVPSCPPCSPTGGPSLPSPIAPRDWTGDCDVDLGDTSFGTIVGRLIEVFWKKIESKNNWNV